jgi:4-diphosphocytidyl-2-C-methyl-D-erythritol kinase
VRLRAHAKINYALEVTGRRPDGYHDIRSVMQSISLADDVEIERGGKGLELLVEPEGTEIGPPEQNSVYRAWLALQKLTGCDIPVRVLLRKRIPAGAGLAGGSADAAAALVGLNEILDLRLDQVTLRSLGVQIGADVPFCLTGGTALGEGVGENLTTLPAAPDHYLIIAKPQPGADTGAVYRLHDQIVAEPGDFVRPVVGALEGGDLTSLASSIGNDLAIVTERLVPEVASLRERLLALGALGGAMTGSGTAVYGIFQTEAEARSAAERIQAPFVDICGPATAGVEMLQDA